MFLNKHSLDILKGDGCFLVFSVTMWGFVCFEDDTWVLSLLWGDKQNQGTIVLCAHKLSSRQPFLSPYIPAKLPSRPPSTGGWLVKTELSLKLRHVILSLLGYLHIKHKDVYSDVLQNILFLLGICWPDGCLPHLILQDSFLRKCPALASSFEQYEITVVKQLSLISHQRMETVDSYLYGIIRVIIF